MDVAHGDEGSRGSFRLSLSLAESKPCSPHSEHEERKGPKYLIFRAWLPIGDFTLNLT